MNRVAILAVFSLIPALASAEVCLDRPHHETMSDNGRTEAEVICEDGETLVGAFTEDHPGSYAYWLDGVGVLCADDADPSTVTRRYITADLDLSTGAVSDIDCDGATPTGIAFNHTTEIGRTHIDGAALLCGSSQSVGDFGARDDDTTAVTPLGCDAGEALVGLAYKDHDNRDGLAFTDAVGFIAPICGAYDAEPDPVDFNQYLMNTRTPIELTCDDGEIFIGAFYEDHSITASDWVDGVGIYCADAEDTSEITTVFESSDITGEEDHVLMCGEDGVSGLTYSEATHSSRVRVDGFQLSCADGSDSELTENLAASAANPSCPTGEVAVGIAYKDAQTADNTWSDSVETLTVLCAPATCQ